MRDWQRQVVVTGAGICCHLGDDLGQIAGMLREGRTLPFVTDPRAVETGARCQIFGSYRGALELPRTPGPPSTASAACAGGAYNILLAAELIEHGHVEAAIAGAAEAADPHFHAGFDAMRAMNGQDNDRPDRASRPYAADRAGFIFGEGAGMLVLETAAHAAARGAKVLGAIRGYGMSSDGAGEMGFPSEEGATLAIDRALPPA